MATVEVPTLALDDSVKTRIENILGTNFIGVSDSKSRESDTTWQGYFAALKIFAQQAAGSTAAWQHVPEIPGDGLNLRRQEMIDRNKDPDKVLKGAINIYYGRDFQRDLAGFAPYITKNVGIVNNLASPLIGLADINQVNVTEVLAETDLLVKLLAERDVLVDWIQLCEEMMISGNEDIVKLPSDYSVLCNKIIPTFRTKYPDALLFGCTFPADKNTKSDWKEANKGLPLDGWSQHFQYDEDLSTYALNRARTAEFPSFCDQFQQDYPDKFMALSQALTITGDRVKANPFQHNLGEAMIYWELAISIIKENANRNNLVKKFVIGTAERHIGASEDFLYPLYHFTKLAGGMFRNTKLIDASFSNTPGAENLVAIAVRKDFGGTRAYVINTSDRPVTVDAVTLNGKTKKVKVEAVYGNSLFDDVVRNYASDQKAASAEFKQNGITKLSFK